MCAHSLSQRSQTKVGFSSVVGIVSTVGIASAPVRLVVVLLTV
jgi:hypothetical protein